jgi:hypothetical protein
MITQIISKVNCKYGSPMGRSNVGSVPDSGIRIYDRKIRLNSGGYDAGGAYWGIGAELRVSYTKDLSYISFYRKYD